MTQLPTGTVTFLFSDIEGSTRLLQEHADEYGGLLARHRELLRVAFRTGGGIEIETEGDAFFVAFPTAEGAVQAAIAAQRALAAEAWPGGASLRVRMGLLTGEAEVREGGYIGLAVHRAARLAGAAHGGQVLIAEPTQALLAAGRVEGFEIRDLGEHRLKDIDAPERLFQLVVDGLPSDFPPPRTLSMAATQLPEPLTSFLGRDQEIAEVLALIDRARLVTLTGPGGVGKTRLAIEVARRQIGRFRDGVTFVSLAPIRELELVVPTMAAALGLPDSGGREPMARLLDHLRDRRLLVVLDNLEHLQAAAPEVAELLSGAPGLSVLATGRAPLQIYGEQQYSVPALALPPAAGAVDLEALAGTEAVSLFVERASSVARGFRLDDANVGAVVEICRRLDGLPLAIELAAARAKVLPPPAMLTRLGDRLSLRGGARDVPERQQSLRAAIAWSYDLLDEPARKVFEGMSTFVGGMSLDAAETVLTADSGDDVLDTLGTLVDASLVRRVDIDGEPRFTMLETIRAFAGERLAASGQLEEVRRRHAEHFAKLAALARPEVLGPQAGHWLDRLELEHDNVRAVLAWAVERGDARLALRLTADVWRFWQRRGFLVEGLRRARAALELPGEVDLALRADALEAAGGLAYWQADAATTRELYEQVLAIRREQGDPLPIAEALYNLSFSYTWLSISDEAARPDPKGALRLLDEALALFGADGDRAGQAKVLWGIGTCEFLMGRLGQSREHVRQAERLARELDDAFLIPWVLYIDAVVSLGLGDVEHVRPALAEALERFAKADDVSAYTLILDAFAALALQRGDRQRAARLSGGVAELETRSGTGLNRINRRVIGFDPEALRADPSLAEAWVEGARMDDATLSAYALAEASPV